MQSNYGFDGQIHACWTHKMSQMEFELMRSSGFFVSVIHGRYNLSGISFHFFAQLYLFRQLSTVSMTSRNDVIAQLRHAKRLAERLHPFSRMIELPGGHLVSHERTKEVNTYVCM